MQAADSQDSQVAAPSSRWAALDRLLTTPLEKYLPPWLRGVILSLIAIIPVALHLAMRRDAAQSSYDIAISIYEFTVKQVLQADQSFDDVSINTVPRPSFWSDQSPYIVVTGEIAEPSDYSRMITTFNNPVPEFLGNEPQDRIDPLVNAVHRGDYKVMIDVTIRETGERKQETLVIPKAKDGDEDDG